MSEKIYKISSWLLAISMVINILPLPGRTVAQAPDLPEPMEDIVASGEIYMDGVIGATGASFEIMQLLETINQTPLSELDEALVQQAREKALESAEQSARARGAVTPLADAVQQVSDEFPAAIDVLSEAQVLYADLPDETIDDLHTIGMTDADIAAFSSGVIGKAETRVDMRQNGLPAGVEAQLIAAGFSADEIAQIEASFQQRGVFQSGLTTRMDQFRAARDELSTARTQAIIIYVQLLRYQIAARQAAGIAPRAPVDAELEELAQNEVRLLTHIAHLDELMAGGANPDAGEGDWWAIERYSTRAVEQIDTLIVDTQNLGLVVDLFVLLDIRTAAITAQAGDPTYAKIEADSLADLLAYLTGDDQLAKGEQARYARVPWWSKLPVLGSLFDVPVARAAEISALEMTQARLEAGSSAEGLALQAAGMGQIEESDEENNVSSLIFGIGLETEEGLSPDLVQAILDAIDDITLPQVGEFFLGVLTGNSDNPLAIAINMGLSFIDGVDTVLDIASLIGDPDLIGKAGALIGILTNLGTLTALIPAGVTQVTGGLSWLGNQGTDFMLGLYRLAKTAGEVYARHLSEIRHFDHAFQIIWDLLTKNVDTLSRLVTELPSNIDELGQLLRTVVDRVWEPFKGWSEFLHDTGRVVDSFPDAGLLVGFLKNAGLSDEALKVVEEVVEELGPDAAKRIGEMSDEAKKGLGMLAAKSGGDDIAKKLLSEYSDDVAQKVLAGAKNWDSAAHAGFEKLAKNINSDDLTVLLAKYADAPDAVRQSLNIISKRSFEKWAPDTVDTIINFVKKAPEPGEVTRAAYVDALLERMFETGIPTDPIFNDMFKKMLIRLDGDATLRAMLAPQIGDPVRNGMIQLLRTVENKNFDEYGKLGFNYQIDRAKFYFERPQIGGDLVMVEQDLEGVSIDLLLRNGIGEEAVETLVECKYWRDRHTRESIKTLASQIERQVGTGRKVLVEFGTTEFDGIQPSTLQLVVNELTSRGVDPDMFLFVIMP